MQIKTIENLTAQAQKVLNDMVGCMKNLQVVESGVSDVDRASPHVRLDALVTRKGAKSNPVTMFSFVNKGWGSARGTVTGVYGGCSYSINDVYCEKEDGSPDFERVRGVRICIWTVM